MSRALPDDTVVWLNGPAALVVAAVAIAAGLIMSQYAAAASFDCARTVAASDKAICANPTLSAKDDELSRLYGQRKSELQSQGGDVQAFVADGRRWLAMRMACIGNVPCLNLWFDERIAELRTRASASTNLAPSSSPAFKQGQADRLSWESWFAGVTGDYHAGAEYWAAHRSDQRPPSCGASPPSTGDDWTAGCYAAQQKLADSDLRRKTELDYRRGWNNPPTSQSATTAIATTPNRADKAELTKPALKFPALTGRVNDEAALLSPAERERITGWLAQFEQATKRQVVVATVKSLQGYSIEDYGYQLGRYWGIGEQGKNTGAILLVAPTERKVRIEVGYGLEGELTDAISRTIINDDILPSFRQGNYRQGITTGVSAMLAAMGWKVTPETTSVVAQAGPTSREPEAPVQPPELGSGDIAAIVDTSRTNEMRFNRDFKGKQFTASGVFAGAEEDIFQRGQYRIEIRTPGGEVDCATSDPLILNKAVDWRTGQPVNVSGPVETTVMGMVMLRPGACAVAAK